MTFLALVSGLPLEFLIVLERKVFSQWYLRKTRYRALRLFDTSLFLGWKKNGISDV